jgi:hypothetical protein
MKIQRRNSSDFQQEAGKRETHDEFSACSRQISRVQFLVAGKFSIRCQARSINLLALAASTFVLVTVMPIGECWFWKMAALFFCPTS